MATKKLNQLQTKQIILQLESVLQDVDHALDLAMRMPSLNLLELTYVDWDGWRKYLDGEHNSVQEDFELRAHLEFLNHTQTAVCKWRGSMDWKVLETRQTHNYTSAGSFVRLMRYISRALFMCYSLF